MCPLFPVYVTYLKPKTLIEQFSDTVLMLNNLFIEIKPLKITFLFKKFTTFFLLLTICKY